LGIEKTDPCGPYGGEKRRGEGKGEGDCDNRKKATRGERAPCSLTRETQLGFISQTTEKAHRSEIMVVLLRAATSCAGLSVRKDRNGPQRGKTILKRDRA